MADLTPPPTKNCPEAPNTVQSGKVNCIIRICQYKKCLDGLKDDKTVMFLISAGRATSTRAVQQQRKHRFQTLSSCEGCRIRSSLRNEADEFPEISLV